MSSGAGVGGVGGAGGAWSGRRRAPPPPRGESALLARLSELSLDQGYHTLADSASPSAPAAPRRRRDTAHSAHNAALSALNDALWMKILQYLDISDLCRASLVCRRWRRLSDAAVGALGADSWRRVAAAGGLEAAVRGAGARAGALAAAVREWKMSAPIVTVLGAQQLAGTFRQLTHVTLSAAAGLDARALAPLLTELQDLTHIDLTGCVNVDWPEWAWLSGRLGARRPPVALVDLTDCAALTDAGLASLLHTCPALQYLYLRRCTLITDAGVRWIPSFCALKELSVSDCARVTDFALYEVSRLGASLRYVSAAKCRVSDAGVAALARRCYRLRYVNVRGCGALGDAGVAALARACGRLRALDLGATDVADAGLQTLARCCPNLKKLGLRGCELVTDAGLEAVAYYCRGLTQLNIQDTAVTALGYRAVKRYCKRCVIEHTNPGFC